jgi:hypothetical protein
MMIAKINLYKMTYDVGMLHILDSQSLHMHLDQFVLESPRFSQIDDHECPTIISIETNMMR